MSLGRSIEPRAECTMAMDAPRDNGRPRSHVGSFPCQGCGPRAQGEGDRGRETGEGRQGRVRGKGGLTPPTWAPMIGEHRQLITYFPCWVGLRNNELKFKTAGKRPISLRGNYRVYPNLIKENRRMSTCIQLTWQTLGSQPVTPKNLPHHFFTRETEREPAFGYSSRFEGLFSSIRPWVSVAIRIRLGNHKDQI
jgi:hypothetical protein